MLTIPMRPYQLCLHHFYLNEFINKFINNNILLNNSEKEFMRQKVNKEEGPWRLKKHVKNVFKKREAIVVNKT